MLHSLGSQRLCKGTNFLENVSHRSVFELPLQIDKILLIELTFSKVRCALAFIIFNEKTL